MDISPSAVHWISVVLIWIGFGTLAGLLAKTVLPGRNPTGAVGTMVIGIAGSTLGLFVFERFFLKSAVHDFNPISPLGMLAAFAGAFVLLIVYRAVATCVIIDQPPEKPEDKDKD